MKKLAALFLALVLLLSLCACGTNTPGVFVSGVASNSGGVPEPIDVEDLSDKYGYASSSVGVPESLVVRDLSLNGYDSYTITHDYDPNSHTDYLTVDAVESDEFYDKCYSWTCAYQYDRMSDLWSIYREPSGGEQGLKLIPERFIRSFEGTSETYGASYSVNITSIDFERETVTGTFSASGQDYVGPHGKGHYEDYSLNRSGEFYLDGYAKGYYHVTFEDSDYTFVFMVFYYGIQLESVTRNGW